MFIKLKYVFFYILEQSARSTGSNTRWVTSRCSHQGLYMLLSKLVRVIGVKDLIHSCWLLQRFSVDRGLKYWRYLSNQPQLAYVFKPEHLLNMQNCFKLVQFRVIEPVHYVFANANIMYIYGQRQNNSFIRL